MNISRQVLFIMVLLVWHYTTICTGVGKTVARRGGEPVLAILISWISRQWVLVFEQRHCLRFLNAVNSGRTCIRSTFKLNTLYNIVPYSTMICFGVGLSQQFAEKAAVYCFLARVCTSHSPSYREKDSGLKTTGVTPFAIFTKPFITQQFSPPLAPKRRSTWT